MQCLFQWISDCAAHGACSATCTMPGVCPGQFWTRATYSFQSSQSETCTASMGLRSAEGTLCGIVLDPVGEIGGGVLLGAWIPEQAPHVAWVWEQPLHVLVPAWGKGQGGPWTQCGLWTDPVPFIYPAEPNEFPPALLDPGTDEQT